jgi:hypothetical protein
MAGDIKYKIELPARIIFNHSPDVVVGMIVCENYSGEGNVIDVPRFKFMPSANPTQEIVFAPWQVSMITFL